MKKKFKTQIDQEEEEEYYEPTESDDSLDEEETILLNPRKKNKDDDSEEEVFGIGGSSNEEDEEEDGNDLGSEFDSDIGDKNEDEDLIDSKAWGKDTRKFYNTDYVDKDYGGMSKEEEEEAEMEEQEALNIQKRLMSHLDETDFTLGLLDKVKEKKAELATVDHSVAEKETIIADLSTMSSSEKIQFLKHESPELFQLVDDYKEKMTLAHDKLRPVMELVKNNRLKKCSATDFVETYYAVILNYCTNIIFYLLLKSRKRGAITDHPVIGRLYTYKKLISEMDDKMQDKLIDQLEILLKQSVTDKEMVFEEYELPAETGNRAQRRKRKQLLFAEVKKAEKKAKIKKMQLEAEEGKEKEIQEPLFSESDEEVDKNNYEEEDNIYEEEEADEEMENQGSKRSITYEMSKNRGLTPRRKKENRNPRVKNRNKYRKATIRRKGQVRAPRTEVKRYDGEISGIKSHTVKSTKFKY